MAAALRAAAVVPVAEVMAPVAAATGADNGVNGPRSPLAVAGLKAAEGLGS